jgi:hypothetical protein
MEWDYRVLRVEDVMKALDIGQSKAYQIMRKINKELEAAGYVTIAGRVSEAAFVERFYCGKHRESQSNTNKHMGAAETRSKKGR